MPKLKMRDKQTGEVFEIEWSGQGAPTDADIEQLRQKPSAAREFVGVMQDNPITSMVADPAAAVMDKGWAESLPYVGGMIGSLAGGKRTPVGVGLAALGGATGEAAKDAIQGQPITATNLLKAGAIQGGTELFGRGLAGGLQRGATKIYTGNLKPSKVKLREFPNAPQAMLDKRVIQAPVGMDQTERLIEKSAQDATRIAAEADAAGQMPIFGAEIVPHFDPYLQRLGLRERGGSDVASDIAEMVSRRNRTLNAPTATVTEGVAIKREQQKLADQARRQVEAGAKALSTDDELAMASARGWQEATEKRAPKLKEVNAQTRDFIGGKEMLEDTLARERTKNPFGPRDFLSAAAATGGGMLTGNPYIGAGIYGLTRALVTPRSGSMIAIGMNEAGKYIPFANALRAAIAAKLGLDDTAER